MDDFQKTLDRIAHAPIQRKPKGCFYNTMTTLCFILLVRVILFLIECLFSHN